jgi:hypothetical protein
MFLHAWRLQFNHPATGERVELLAPLPPSSNPSSTMSVRPRQFDLIAFDWDGTLFDSTGRSSCAASSAPSRRRGVRRPATRMRPM